MPSSVMYLVEVQRRFGETYCLHTNKQEASKSVAETSGKICKIIWRHISEDNAVDILCSSFEIWPTSSFIFLFTYSCLL
jgi:hypothetical protein